MKYSGAWLTDIDDTLIRSGLRPDDNWIDELGEFIRDLKAHNIVWVPVSGVALDKMGERLLFRLPKDVLSHILYYGGEGGVKSFYSDSEKQWVSPDYFQQNFSDAQALVLIGEKRFAHALHHQYKINCKVDNNADCLIQKRITAATTLLKESRYIGMLSLVDQMQQQLDDAGFSSTTSETFYRGGAISWMMFGDVSVEQYKGVKETQCRSEINSFIRNKLVELDYLQDIGVDGVHMPYLHATRGIKLVLKGNDKSRAVQDLIEKENVKINSLLFVGNELFDGGNDNPVRRYKDLKVLSVGENEDSNTDINKANIINGGIQIEANSYWMKYLAKSLVSGKEWNSLLDNLPHLAEQKVLLDKIDNEKTSAHHFSPWHERISRSLSSSLLLELYLSYRTEFLETRECLLKVNGTRYSLVTRLAVLSKFNYDNARKIISDVLTHEDTKANQSAIKNEIKLYLLPEITDLIRTLLVDHMLLNPSHVNKSLDIVSTTDELKNATVELIQLSESDNNNLEAKRKLTLIDNWSAKIDDLIDDYFNSFNQWQRCLDNEKLLVISSSIVRRIDNKVNADDVYEYLRWLIARIDNFLHLKDLDKPTIVLVAGTSGVGKSTISRYLSKTLGIPTGFSSDVASRSVMREAIVYLLGNEAAEQLYPEIFGSSFDQDTSNWFYAHSLMTMVGVIGNIKRLISENISSVIDGVALIPGTLPEIYFEKANVVWVVASVKDKQQHYQRLGMRSETGLERGGAEHYWKQFDAIRNNHDRLVEMAEKSQTFIVDNSASLDYACQKVFDRVSNAIADRGLPVVDEIRDSVRKSLHERTTWEVQNRIMPIPVDNED